MPFDADVHLWLAGSRAIASAPPFERAALELVVDAAVDELRRRLGGAASSDDLAAHYDQGTDWCLGLATRVAPEAPWAWDSAAADAAYARFWHETTDYAGGRRIA